MCHQLEERSLFIGIRQFPVCARCTGIYIGFILGLIAGFFLMPNPLMCIAFIIAMVADGLIQLKTRYHSTNMRRLVTGLAFGYGIASILALIAQIVY